MKPKFEVGEIARIGADYLVIVNRITPASDYSVNFLNGDVEGMTQIWHKDSLIKISKLEMALLELKSDA